MTLTKQPLEVSDLIYNRVTSGDLLGSCSKEQSDATV